MRESGHPSGAWREESTDEFGRRAWARHEGRYGCEEEIAGWKRVEGKGYWFLEVKVEAAGMIAGNGEAGIKALSGNAGRKMRATGREARKFGRERRNWIAASRDTEYGVAAGGARGRSGHMECG